MADKKGFNNREGLDRAGRRIIGASNPSDSEAAALAAAPFLYSRIRARIASEEREQKAADFWGGLALAARRAIPAMCLTAAVSLGLLLYVNGNKSTSTPFSVDAYLGTGESGIDNLLFAERRQLTTDEVLSTVLSRDEREASK